MLAPLAGIGNWFVRLQAKRYGAGLAVSEMVSSHAVHYGNERTLTELLRIHPDEHPVSVQLFGADPEVMASAAERVAQAGADLIDINMGCPVPKVCKTGAGAALLDDPDRAVAVARAAARASGLPVTVKLRTGLRPGDGKGVAVARDLAERGEVAGLCIHPRDASQRHAGQPDYELAAQLVRELPVPVLISGGLRTAELARAAFERTGAEAILLARGSLGNPWLFDELVNGREHEPTREEIVDGARTGCSTAPSSTWAPSARIATCASSIRGTSSASAARAASRRRCRRRFSRPRASSGLASCSPGLRWVSDSRLRRGVSRRSDPGRTPAGRSRRS